MKKYFCKTCGKFKTRFDITFESYCHPQNLVSVCKWCHERNVISTEEIIEELYNKSNNKNLESV